MKYKGIFLVFFALSYRIIFSQEMVKNGDFEDYFQCPTTYSKRSYAPFLPNWKSPDAGTPDYFNACSLESGVPYNWAGKAFSNFGNGYVGLYLYGAGYREYIQTTFDHPLKKGEEYQFSMDYILASYSHLSVDRIGVKILYQNDSSFLKEYIKKEAIDTLTGTWEHVVDTFLATGMEVGLIIGNFATDFQSKSFEIPYREDLEPMFFKKAYYFIDNVSVWPLSVPHFQDTIQLQKTYTLSRIHFEFNSAILDEPSIQELENLADYLLKSGNSIQIDGHTDEIGDAAYNQRLSLLRAKAVRDALISYGVKAKMIRFQGFGKSKPLNSTGKEDLRNRRVEFTIVKNF